MRLLSWVRLVISSVYQIVRNIQKINQIQKYKNSIFRVVSGSLLRTYYKKWNHPTLYEFLLLMYLKVIFITILLNYMYFNYK